MQLSCIMCALNYFLGVLYPKKVMARKHINNPNDSLASSMPGNFIPKD